MTNVTETNNKPNLLDVISGHLLVTGDDSISFFEVDGAYVEFPEEKRGYAVKLNPNEKFKPILIEEPFTRAEHYKNFLAVNEEQFIDLFVEFKEYCRVINRPHVHQAFLYTLQFMVEDGEYTFSDENAKRLGIK